MIYHRGIQSDVGAEFKDEIIEKYRVDTSDAVQQLDTEQMTVMEMFGAAVDEISPRWLYDYFSPLHETSMANAWDKAEKA